MLACVVPCVKISFFTLCAQLDTMHNSHRLLQYNTMYLAGHAAFGACTSDGMLHLMHAGPLCDSSSEKGPARCISTMFGIQQGM